MPNSEQLRKAAERREARAAAKQSHVEQSEQEGQELAALSEEQNKPGFVPPARPPKRDRAADRIAAKARAEKQADEDAKVTAREPDIDAALAHAQRGGHLPLHVLNAMAREADQGIRNEAREIGKAAGAAAHDAALSLRPERSRHKRFIKARRLNDLMKQGESK